MLLSAHLTFHGLPLTPLTDSYSTIRRSRLYQFFCCHPTAFPQTWQPERAPVYRHSFRELGGEARNSRLHKVANEVSARVVLSPATPLRKELLPTPCSCWQNATPSIHLMFLLPGCGPQLLEASHRSSLQGAPPSMIARFLKVGDRERQQDEYSNKMQCNHGHAITQRSL